MKIDPVDFGPVVSGILQAYSEDVTKTQTAAFDEIANNAKEKVVEAARKQSTVADTGHDWHQYISAFQIVKETDTKTGTTRIVCVKGPQYRLTHLLENGHALRSGGRTRKFPHFVDGQEYLDKEAEKVLINKLEAIP